MENSLCPCIEELERFYKFLNKRFDLKLPDKVIMTIQSRGGSKSAVGWFSPLVWKIGKDEVNEINLSAECLKNNNPYETVAHEVAHYYNNLNKIKDIVGVRHNKKFKETAERLLLKVDKQGWRGFAQTSPTEQFEEMVEKEFKPKKDVFNIFRDSKRNKVTSPQQKRYVCECGIVIRSPRKDLDIKCNKCGNNFEEE